MKKAYLNWSSGKDAALALYRLRHQGKLEVSKLLTTINSDLDRISMHGLRKELLLAQVQQIGLPLKLVSLPGMVSSEVYNQKMRSAVEDLKQEGFTHSVFGDIFLEDLKKYREEQLAGAGLKAVFPLWKNDTAGLMREFIEVGFKAIVVTTSSRVLDPSFCGRLIDESFIKDLPEGVDPCGENGEFHTFVFDGPIFKTPVSFEIGEKKEEEYAPSKDWDTRFCYCDLIPA